MQKPIVWMIKEDYISLHTESQGEFPPTSDLTLVWFKHKEIIFMNELRKNYKSFEEGLKDYIASFMAAERDFGCYAPPNEEEKKWLTERFKSLWEAEDCKMEDAVFRYY